MQGNRVVCKYSVHGDPSLIHCSEFDSLKLSDSSFLNFSESISKDFRSGRAYSGADLDAR